MSRSSKNGKPLKQGLASTGSSSHADIPRTTLQKCLNIFHNALWTSQDDLVTLQEVKRHLYDRDFAAAFSKSSYLQAYALRWSPSRSLCYGNIFQSISRYVVDNEGETTPLQVTCIGGGAGAELVGLAAWLNSNSRGQLDGQVLSLKVNLIDIASWDQVTKKLYSSIIEPPLLSEYASASARANNTAFVAADRFNYSFQRADVLDLSIRYQWTDAARGANLLTIMFALNELYTTSMAQTQRLLRDLTSLAQPGAMLLVVDSPGSYSTVSLNGSEKKYPMQWLLDYTLRGPPNAPTANAQWTRVFSEESTWFRLPEGLQYPVELENMRYQIHLYKRVSGNEAAPS